MEQWALLLKWQAHLLGFDESLKVILVRFAVHCAQRLHHLKFQVGLGRFANPKIGCVCVGTDFTHDDDGEWGVRSKTVQSNRLHNQSRFCKMIALCFLYSTSTWASPRNNGRKWASLQAHFHGDAFIITPATVSTGCPYENISIIQ